MLSDGHGNSSEHDLVDAITESQATDTLVCAVRTTRNRNDHMSARDRYGERVLRHLTEATGGRAFDAATTSAKEIFASIADDLRSLYELGYYSTHGDSDTGFRKVDVLVAEGLRPSPRRLRRPTEALTHSSLISHISKDPRPLAL